MSHRLQVLISLQLDSRLTREAQRNRVSKGEWVRRVLERAVKNTKAGESALDRLAALHGPTADIDRMLLEIDAGRS
jgi:hypothetical protein